MKKHLKKYLIPHDGNNNHPHLLRGAGVSFLMMIVVALFAGAVSSTLINQKGRWLSADVVSATLVDLVNKDRTESNLHTLVVDPILSKAATLKAQDMAEKSYFSHTSPDGLGTSYWFSQVGYKFVYAGENLAVNYSESSDVESAWMASAGHRSNILNDKFSDVGIGVATGMFEGKETVFVAELFGRRAIPVATVNTPAKSSQTQKVSANKTSVEQVKQSPKSTQQAIPVIAPSPIPEQLTHVVAVKDSFIAIKDPTQTEAPIPQTQVQTGGTTPFETGNALSPENILRFGYIAIVLLVLFVLGLTLTKRFKFTHIKSLTYAASVIALMLALSYVYGAFVVSQVLVV